MVHTEEVYVCVLHVCAVIPEPTCWFRCSSLPLPGMWGEGASSRESGG